MVEISKKTTRFLVILLLLAIIVLNLFGIIKNSIGSDEHAYIYTGYTEYKVRDIIIRKEYAHGPLVPVVNTIPLLFMNLRLPANHSELANRSMYETSPEFLYDYNGQDFYRILVWSRLGTVLLSLLFAIILFEWTKNLFGTKAGLISLSLYTFCPIILSVSTIIGKDLAVTFFIFATFYFLWLFYKRGKTANLLLAGLMLGLGQVSDYPAIFAYPLIGLLLAIMVIARKDFRFSDKRLEKKLGGDKKTFWNRVCSASLILLVLLLISYAVIIITYASTTYGLSGLFQPFKTSLMSDPDIIQADAMGVVDGNPLFKFVAEKIPSPLPYYYVKGFALNVWVSGGISQPNPTYIVDGKTQVVWYYFIISYLLKTPLAAILLFIIGFFLMISRKRPLEDLLFLAIPIIVYNVIFAFTTKQLAYKYILPVIPFMLIISGYSAESLKVMRSKSMKIAAGIIIAALLIWCAVSSSLVAPHYGSYFNELVGGPKNGYLYFTQTNVEWGHDLYYLKDYLRENNITDFKFRFYGYPTLWTDDLPEVYDIPYNKLACGKQEGIVVISPTYLTEERDCYGWLWNETPAKRIGYSLFVYNITPNP